MELHTYHGGIEVYIDPPSHTELARYRKGSARSLKGYLRRKGRWINTVRNTVTNYTPLLLLALPLAAQLHA